MSRSIACPRVAGPVVLLLVLAGLVSYPARDGMFRAVAEWTARSPLDGAVEVFTEVGLLVLVATAAVVAVWSLLRDHEVLGRLVTGGVGVITAYLVSEVTKNIVREPRPCAAGDVLTVLTCPEAGSWSWPSNHSTLAAAFAVACAFAVPRLGWFTVPLAVAAAFSRVAAGVHYVHDVLAGLALGVAVISLGVALLGRVVPQVLSRMGLLRSARVPTGEGSSRYDRGESIHRRKDLS